MFGQNPIRSADYADPTHLAIEETFYTIQGEGPYAGQPAVFIRLSGCNLACHFCDTQFEKMAEVKQDVTRYLDWFNASFTGDQRRLIVITGGEPMRQNLGELLVGLLAPDRNTEIIQIETAGTLWQPEYPAGWQFSDMLQDGEVVLVCSPKTPKVHAEIEAACNHWKYVIKAGEVDEWGIPNRSTQLVDGKLRGLYRPKSVAEGMSGGALEFTGHETIWLSPCDEYDGDKNMANLAEVRELSLKHGHRISIQMHKLLGVA